PPPDREARAALVASAMTDRPGAGIDPGKIAKHTEGFSGADLTHLVDSAAERAMLDSARTGTVRPITMDDFQAVLAEVRPSTGPWLETARNVAEASGDSAYDELGAYLRAQRRTRRQGVSPVAEAVERAETRLAMKRPEEALEIIGKALAGEPESAELWLVKSKAHLSADDPAGAVRAARRALAAGAGGAAPHYLLALALFH